MTNIHKWRIFRKSVKWSLIKNIYNKIFFPAFFSFFSFFLNIKVHLRKRSLIGKSDRREENNRWIIFVESLRDSNRVIKVSCHEIARHRADEINETRSTKIRFNFRQPPGTCWLKTFKVRNRWPEESETEKLARFRAIWGRKSGRRGARTRCSIDRPFVEAALVINERSKVG